MTRWGSPKVALLLAVVIVLSVAGLWAALRALTPDPIPPATVSVTLQIEAADWNSSYSATTTNNTVLGLLFEAGDASGYSVAWSYDGFYQAAYVDEINGIRDGAGGLFWQYWVNGAFGQVAADRYMLVDGDAVLWRHTTFSPGP